MKISLIAAMAKNRVIGKHNRMPWHLPADLHHFKQITWHKPVVMGRKTFTSIGRPLPGRRNIVLSREVQAIPQVEIYHSIGDIMAALINEAEIMIIGGEMLFTQTLHLAQRMYLTHIDAEIDGDTFFPAWRTEEWRVVSRESHKADLPNPYSYEFVNYERLI